MDATVEGADEAFVIRTVTLVNGTETPSVSVTAALGDVIVTGSSIMGEDLDAATGVVQKLVDVIATG